jgi:hypothetical protein
MDKNQPYILSCQCCIDLKTNVMGAGGASDEKVFIFNVRKCIKKVNHVVKPIIC